MNFHTRMSALSGHIILQQLLAVLSTHTRRFIILSNLHKGDLISDIESHERLVTALLSGDPDITEREVRNTSRMQPFVCCRSRLGTSNAEPLAGALVAAPGLPGSPGSTR